MPGQLHRDAHRTWSPGTLGPQQVPNRANAAVRGHETPGSWMYRRQKEAIRKIKKNYKARKITYSEGTAFILQWEYACPRTQWL